MAGRHREHLSGYLDKHKTGRGRGSSGRAAVNLKQHESKESVSDTRCVHYPAIIMIQ